MCVSRARHSLALKICVTCRARALHRTLADQFIHQTMRHAAASARGSLAPGLRNYAPLLAAATAAVVCGATWLLIERAALRRFRSSASTIESFGLLLRQHRRRRRH